MDPITIRAFHDELQHLQFEKNAIIDRDTIARGARLLATDVTDPALGAFSKATRALGFRAGVGGLPGPLRRPLLWPHELDALEHRVSSGIKNNIQEPLINGAKHLVGTSIGGRTLPPTLQHKVTNAVRGVVEQPTDVMMNAVGIFAPPGAAPRIPSNITEIVQSVDGLDRASGWPTFRQYVKHGLGIRTT